MNGNENYGAYASTARPFDGSLSAEDSYRVSIRKAIRVLTQHTETLTDVIDHIGHSTAGIREHLAHGDVRAAGIEALRVRDRIAGDAAPAGDDALHLMDVLVGVLLVCAAMPECIDTMATDMDDIRDDWLKAVDGGDA